MYVYLFSAINAIFIGYGLGDNILIYKHLVWAILPSLLVASVILLTKPYSIIIEVFLYINATIWNLLTISQAIMFQSIMDAPSLYIIMTTNAGEISGFFDFFLTFEMIAITLVVILLPLPLWYYIRKNVSLPSHLRSFVFLLFSLLLMLLPVYDQGLLPQGLKNRGIKVSNIDWNIRKLCFIQYATYVPEALLLGKLAAYEPENVHTLYDGEQNIIIIVMESSFKQNFSLYGYPRKTNPNLENFDLLIYDDVLSPSPVTSHSLPHMYTFSNLQNSTQITTIHDLFRVAGFETHYFREGNPNKVNYNDIIHLIADRAENIHRQAGYDHELLEKALEVYKESKAEKKLLVIETGAAHFPYRPTYPSDFKEFTDLPPNLFPKAEPERRNYYDTSILYLDTIIADFLDEVQNSKNTLVLITSDHGNEVGYYSTSYGHSNSSKFLSCFEIPFFLWISDDYKKSLSTLIFDTSRPYQNDNLLHSIIDLAHIETELFKPELSLFNKEYKEQIRTIQGSEYYSYKAKVDKERQEAIEKANK